MKALFPLLLPFYFLTVASSLWAQEKVHWVPLQEALQRAPLEQKKIMVHITMKNCVWCKVMEQKTFTHPDVVRQLNIQYLSVRFDAEEEMAIQYKGRTYNQVKQGKRVYHEWAQELMRGRFNYPTVVFLDESTHVIQPMSGYQDPEQYLMVLTYFGENLHRRIPWDKYVQRYKDNGAGIPVNH